MNKRTAAAIKIGNRVCNGDISDGWRAIKLAMAQLIIVVERRA